jgi:hypothetical protein
MNNQIIFVEGDRGTYVLLLLLLFIVVVAVDVDRSWTDALRSRLRVMKAKF